MSNIGLGSQITSTPKTSGGGGSSRTTATITTAVLNQAAVESGVHSLAKTFGLIKVTTSVPSRLRLYSTTGARDADVNRPPEVPPDPSVQNEVICDVVLNANTGTTWVLGPEAFGSDAKVSPDGIIGYNITNNFGSSSSVVWTLIYLPMET